MENKDKFFWCDINLVLPNDKNPRLDPSVKTDELQNIIKTRGWGEAITVYKNSRGPYYTIISGHRRWHAAKLMGHDEVPLYIVDRPEDEVEEIERLGDIQGGQVDWTEYEWAEYTYKIHKQLDHLSFDDLGKRLNISTGLVASRVRVVEYYPKSEIQEKLDNKTFGIRMLDYIRVWIERLKKYHPKLVEDMTEDKVRRLLLRKYENRVLNSYMQSDESVMKATRDQVFQFIVTPDRKLNDLKREIERDNQKRVKNFNHNRRKVSLATKDVDIVAARTKREAEVMKDVLESLQKEVAEKKKYLLQIIEQKNAKQEVR